MKTLFYKTIVASLLLCFTSIASASLVHSYDFNGNANDSVGSANGTVVGATLTSDRFGVANSAYQFNGESYINASFNSPATASFAAWASLGSQTDVGDMLFSMNGNTAVDFWIYEGCNGAMWNIGDSCGNTFSGGNLNTIVRDGLFHHYVVVNDQVNNITSLYIDGLLFGTASYRYTTGSTFRIGAWPASLSYGWDGVIDDVQVYGSALNGTDVASLFATGSVSVPEPSTLAILALGMIGLASRRYRGLK
mmetsp:Transcript_56374/g.178410  ORF Transcript_56374/g.178410 Transcript_56374/m.178410 type:complete len:250 (+) Transcript_56374:17-766(+)